MHKKIMMLNLKDNNSNSSQAKNLSQCDRDNLKVYSSISVRELCANNPGLLVFPNELNYYSDDIDKLNLYQFSDLGTEPYIKTGNLMGFFGIKETQVKIHSRFDVGNNDNFLYYMLSKVFSINIFNLKSVTNNDGNLKLQMLLFPYMLKMALAQGLYKEYQQHKYNDSHIKGSIDVNSQIRLNKPFYGKIAYKIREFSYDNPMTELIRHTIEFIKCSELGNSVLNCDFETKSCVNQIIQATPYYKRNDLQKIKRQNLKVFSHPYYSYYRPLQILCLQILNRQGVEYLETENEIYGILFDGAWLWEEYLATILSKNIGFQHPLNKAGKGCEYLFTDGCKIYPDFIKKSDVLGNTVIVDAKYKHLGNNSDEYERNDFYQVITYMFRFQSLQGFLLYPLDNSGCNNLVHKRHILPVNEDRYLIEYGFRIPQNIVDFNLFVNEIISSEKELVDFLKNN